MCAGHNTPATKRPTVSDGKATQQGKGISSNGMFEGSMKQNSCT